ncbi:alpha-tocopherol transfer protein-like [Aricia agestis]|uniref:alpha-tocopherol transfer protein-like n=1 Tax=Aricia agestis TaxID=91739 RepID=UPI001C20A00B|nr:alpha-tocopherol transfer protein-like [Aricia agestis]
MPECKGFPLELEYKKNTGITAEDIAKLRQWLKTQPHLPEPHITDLDLILAFHSCNRSTEVTKQVLDLHYTLNTLFTNFFSNRTFDAKIQDMLDNILFAPLPTRTPSGDAILYMRILNTDVKVFNIETWIKGFFMVMDLVQYEEGTWPGFQIIVDFEGLGLGHITKVDVTNMRSVLYYLQEALFAKLSGLHYINAPSCIDVLLAMIRPFMKKELMKIFHVHTAPVSELGSFFPVEALPKEAGGKYKTFEECKQDITAKIKNSNAFFEQESLKRVTESLRPGKQKTISDIFEGVEGSFKKLDID